MSLPVTPFMAAVTRAKSSRPSTTALVIRYMRALKDLEYERAVGKINDTDYETLAEHYRNEAKRLLRAVDADLGPERERAEQILAERLAAHVEAEPPAGAHPDPERAARRDDEDLDEPSEPAVAKSPSSGAAP